MDFTTWQSAQSGGWRNIKADDHSEDSIFRRESKRWMYLDPSSLYDSVPPLRRISHN